MTIESMLYDKKFEYVRKFVNKIDNTKPYCLTYIGSICVKNQKTKNLAQVYLKVCHSSVIKAYDQLKESK
jgi:hypothetical protein